MGQKLREEIGSFNYDNLIPDTSFPVQVGVVSIANGQGTLLRGTVLGANATGHYVVADTTESVLGSVILTDTLETKALEEGSPASTVNATAYLSGSFNRNVLTVGGTDMVAQHEANLKINGIYLKSVI